MKKSNNLTTMLFLTALLHLTIILTAVNFLPDSIPVHYDINMNPDRWGSKYELFLSPVFNFIEAVAMYFVSRCMSKQENGENNAKIILLTGSAINIFSIVMTANTLIHDFRAVSGNLDTGNNFVKLITVSMGILIAVTGNFIPKCKINSLIGLRTKWSMKNEDIWFKCQRFGGIFMFFCGILIALSSVLLETNLQIFIAILGIANFIVITMIFATKIIHDNCIKNTE